MTFRKMRRCRKQLVEIMQKPDECERRKSPEELATNVGAGIEHTKIVGSDTRKEGTMTITNIRQNPISESELIHNINDALRTECTISTIKNHSVCCGCKYCFGLDLLIA